jgi:hypothetical protein
LPILPLQSGEESNLFYKKTNNPQLMLYEPVCLIAKQYTLIFLETCFGQKPSDAAIAFPLNLPNAYD